MIQYLITIVLYLVSLSVAENNSKGSTRMNIEFTENLITVKPLIARPWALLLCEIAGLQVESVDVKEQTTVFRVNGELTDRIQELITNFAHHFTGRDFLTRIPYYTDTRANAIEKDEFVLFNVQVLDIRDKWQTIWRFLVDRTDAMPQMHAEEWQDAVRYTEISRNSPSMT